MDQKFKDFLTTKHERLADEAKQSFLSTLKHRPSLVTRFFAENLENWAIEALIGRHIKSAIVLSFEKDSIELTQHFKQHFAKELAAIR